ncbi:MAG: helix-hairpin-helix domain-containing protein [Acidobacteriota bacterium]|nr:helix-hairpin-helix domain-containing protein [Acidobacteriota bacterium]
MPPGAGRDETLKVCGKCHSPEQAASLHQSRTGWEETVSKMVGLGSEGSDEEYTAILDYLTKNFGPEGTHPVSVNKASAVELEAALGITRTESAAIIDYRTTKGSFKTIDDLKNVPGLDFKKVEPKKSRITL